MPFQIHALPAAAFAPLFMLDDAALARRSICRVTADECPGFPCRVSLQDAEPGDTLLLLNHEHLPAASPYRARHAIYVRQGAAQARPDVGAVPDVLACRLLSVRAFDADCMLRQADVVEGREVAPLLAGYLANPAIAFVDLHNARQGCFAARATRAGEGAPFRAA